MGEVIRKTGAVDDILADAATTDERGRLRGGVWKAGVERGLSGLLVIVSAVGVQIAAVKKKLAPLQFALELEDDRADALVHRIYDDVWNLTGRVANDPWLTVLFAEGAGGLVDDDLEGQPARMELVAGLFEAKVHPRLPEEKAKGFAQELRVAAGALREKLDLVRGPRAELKQLEKIRAALARAAQMELARYKRMLKGEGFSEAEVHEVIPDRPVQSVRAQTAPSEPTA